MAGCKGFSSKVVAIGLFLALSWVFVADAVWGHDWYPSNCCGGFDCAQLPRNAVKWTAAGWLVKETGEVIPEEQGNFSPDGFFHRCRKVTNQPHSKTRKTGSKFCFWYPGGGV